VLKGEHGTTVVYAARFIPDDERRRARETGDEAAAIPFLKRFTVFNIAQCEGLPEELAAPPPPVPEGLILPEAEALLRASGADLRLGGDKAFYVPGPDYIQIPRPEAYFKPINWHRTALHELGHWSGHPSRLARDLSGGFGEIETALEAFDNRPPVFDSDDVARAGAFVSLAGSGDLKIERGYVRPEDEAMAEPEPVDGEHEGGAAPSASEGGVQRAMITLGSAAQPSPEADEEEDAIKPLPERLMTELTAHRTLALRDAVGGDPDTAYLAVLHALALKTFFRFSTATCLELEVKRSTFGHQAPDLNETASAKVIVERHARWAEQLPKEPGALWQTLVGFDTDSRQALFAHRVGLSVNAVHQSWNQGERMAHADALARAVDLDMVAAGWTPTAEAYLGRVTKPRILEAHSITQVLVTCYYEYHFQSPTDCATGEKTQQA